jgi:hypothetical protein
MLKRPDRPDLPDRHRRFRQRRRDGKAVYQVELGCEELDFLIRNLWITEDEVGDRRAVGDAVSRLVADSARRCRLHACAGVSFFRR